MLVDHAGASGNRLKVAGLVFPRKRKLAQFVKAFESETDKL